jgi:hypothetical protein
VLIVVVLFHDFLEMKRFLKELYDCANNTCELWAIHDKHLSCADTH